MIHTKHPGKGQFKGCEGWAALKTLCRDRWSLSQSYVVSIFWIRDLPSLGLTLFSIP
uniref:Uncharacterized protein n=1 Tax=Sciurus vulgaris TaxID=55149 RepID=A0A8D2D5H0_SCIVU